MAVRGPVGPVGPETRSYHPHDPETESVTVWLQRAKPLAGQSKRQHELELSRRLLRTALGQTNADLDRPDLEIIERPSGGPVVPAADQAGVRFSISHSKEWVAVGIARSLAHLGIDIEHGRQDRQFCETARMFCSERERTQLAASDSDEKTRELFYRLWTRKEAMFKSLSTTEQETPMRHLVESTTDEGAKRQVVSGWLGDYCLSVAADRKFSLKVVEDRIPIQPTSPQITAMCIAK